MAREKFKSINFSASSLAIIEQANAIIAALARRDDKLWEKALEREEAERADLEKLAGNYERAVKAIKRAEGKRKE